MEPADPENTEAEEPERSNMVPTSYAHGIGPLLLRATCVVRLESRRGRSCGGTIAIIPVVAGVAVVVRSVVGGVPAEEQLVDAKGKQEKHHNHQEVPRIIVS